MNVGRPLATAPMPSAPFPPSATQRRGLPLLAATSGRQGALSRSADPRRRGFPGPASAHRAASPRRTPVPTSAHPTPRAIRVHRSPR
ncbi:hypothetical protein J2Z21_005751 [Streptomyces griseochromogenes]|uniref:Uncharacterized protein n=1 Tax=Streptomyces griseochromogenes TaxID=68214 RepID=A0ABS4LZC4_9ACTN|nr:hypothetical protein [Streptomyces griseochromogenes]